MTFGDSSATTGVTEDTGTEVTEDTGTEVTEGTGKDQRGGTETRRGVSWFTGIPAVWTSDGVRGREVPANHCHERGLRDCAGCDIGQSHCGYRDPLLAVVPADAPRRARIHHEIGATLQHPLNLCQSFLLYPNALVSSRGLGALHVGRACACAHHQNFPRPRVSALILSRGLRCFSVRRLTGPAHRVTKLAEVL
jgi:hypothetical protein